VGAHSLAPFVGVLFIVLGAQNLRSEREERREKREERRERKGSLAFGSSMVRCLVFGCGDVVCWGWCAWAWGSVRAALPCPCCCSRLLPSGCRSWCGVPSWLWGFCFCTCSVASCQVNFSLFLVLRFFPYSIIIIYLW
jgi:hypothetical protein